MKVDLLIIGAGRSGTTTLFEILKNHPEINFSIVKEIHYFSVEELYLRGISYFHSWFSNTKNGKVTASADTYLLMDKDAPARIQKYNPDMKLIALLREPISRAYSNFHYSKNNGHLSEDAEFIDSIKSESEILNTRDIIKKNNLCHFNGSLYGEHLTYWETYFPIKNILIITTEELNKNLQETIFKIYNFLNITQLPIQNNSVAYNKASKARSKFLQQILLNRNHIIRKLFRKPLLPLKKLIIKSGLINGIHKINKKEMTYTPLTDEMRNKASKYFERDLKILKEKFNICFKQ